MRGASLYPPLYWPRWPGHAARQHWQIQSAQFFLCPGRTSGLSYHLTFGKCPINQNNLLKHWKRVLFQTAQTSTSEDNIKRSDINDLDINISITGHRRTPFFLHLPNQINPSREVKCKKWLCFCRSYIVTRFCYSKIWIVWYHGQWHRLCRSYIVLWAVGILYPRTLWVHLQSTASRDIWIF